MIILDYEAGENIKYYPMNRLNSRGTNKHRFAINSCIFKNFSYVKLFFIKKLIVPRKNLKFYVAKNDAWHKYLCITNCKKCTRYFSVQGTAGLP